MKSWLVWTVYGLGAAVACAVLGIFSVRLTDAEQAQRESDRIATEAVRKAAADEQVRAALWQMDAVLAPFIADETARPYFQYASFYPAEGAYGRQFHEIEPGKPLVPSPLLVNDTPWVVTRFQFEPDGTLTSPELPRAELRVIALRRHLNENDLIEAERRLAAVSALATREVLVSRLPARKTEAREVVGIDMVYADEGWAAQNTANKDDYGKRAESTKKWAQSRQMEQTRQAVAPSNELESAPIEILQGPMSALWFGDSLVLARRISLAGDEYVQGCLLEFSSIRADLVAASGELVPGATFRPASLDPSTVEGANVHRLSALPIEVLPSGVVLPAPADPSVSPLLRVTLGVAWVSMALVALALAFVLRRTMTLSERREEFVSAVTHELRTPLTTFRMYTEMLSSGRVTDEHRGRYYETLHSEALRLSHLVENVLAYARLERGRAQDRIESVPLARLLERTSERLGGRANQAGMRVEVQPAPDDVSVRVDAGAAEQIVFNLVDNACKYAVSATDKRIEISASVEGGNVAIRVRDHGPGVAADVANKLFQPFRKSAVAAANSAPGVGLGLALSRRLARGMGGDLRHEPCEGGTCFVLTLPKA